MKDKISEFLSFEKNTAFEFRNVCGFTFVFEKNILSISEKMASAEIRPVAIIYEKNDEFYLAPLEEVGDIHPIIEKFVEKYLKK